MLTPCKRPPQPPDRIFMGGLYEVRVRDFGSPKPERKIKENGPLPAHGVLAYAPLTPRLRQLTPKNGFQPVEGTSSEDVLKM